MENQEQVNDPTTDSEPASIDCNSQVGRLQLFSLCQGHSAASVRVWESYPVGLGITGGESSTFVTR